MMCRGGAIGKRHTKANFRRISKHKVVCCQVGVRLVAAHAEFGDSAVRQTYTRFADTTMPRLLRRGDADRRAGRRQSYGDAGLVRLLPDCVSRNRHATMKTRIIAEASARLSPNPPWSCGWSRKSPRVAPSGRAKMTAAQNNDTREMPVRK